MTTETKWTPAPWAITGQYGVCKAEISGNTQDRGTCAIAAVWNKTDQRNPKTGKYETMPWPEGEANARLISAAPDLAAALKALLGDYPRFALIGSEHPESDAEFACNSCARIYVGEEPQRCADDCPGELARAALAKATGESNV